jgi:hypothetical protein
MLPDIAPQAIYTANAAAFRAQSYVQHRRIPQATAIVAHRALETLIVQQSLVSLAPHRVLVRKKNLRAERELKPLMRDTEFVHLSERAQWDFQKTFFDWRLLCGELKYRRGLGAKCKHLIRHLKNGQCSFGVSTGFYAALVAAGEHPNSMIILAGIGIEKGGHFCSGNFKPHGYRAEVDAWLFAHLPNSVRSRLYSTDPKLVEIGAAFAWRGRMLVAENQQSISQLERHASKAFLEMQIRVAASALDSGYLQSKGRLHAPTLERSADAA